MLDCDYARLSRVAPTCVKRPPSALSGCARAILTCGLSLLNQPEVAKPGERPDSRQVYLTRRPWWRRQNIIPDVAAAPANTTPIEIRG